MPALPKYTQRYAQASGIPFIALQQDLSGQRHEWQFESAASNTNVGPSIERVDDSPSPSALASKWIVLIGCRSEIIAFCACTPGEVDRKCGQGQHQQPINHEYPLHLVVIITDGGTKDKNISQNTCGYRPRSPGLVTILQPVMRSTGTREAALLLRFSVCCYCVCCVLAVCSARSCCFQNDKKTSCLSFFCWVEAGRMRRDADDGIRVHCSARRFLLSTRSSALFGCFQTYRDGLRRDCVRACSSWCSSHRRGIS